MAWSELREVIEESLRRISICGGNNIVTVAQTKAQQSMSYYGIGNKRIEKELSTIGDWI